MKEVRLDSSANLVVILNLESISKIVGRDKMLFPDFSGPKI
jgi:hypothetical protein